MGDRTVISSNGVGRAPTVEGETYEEPPRQHPDLLPHSELEFIDPPKSGQLSDNLRVAAFAMVDIATGRGTNYDEERPELRSVWLEGHPEHVRVLASDTYELAVDLIPRDRVSDSGGLLAPPPGEAWRLDGAALDAAMGLKSIRTNGILEIHRGPASSADDVEGIDSVRLVGLPRKKKSGGRVGRWEPRAHEEEPWHPPYWSKVLRTLAATRAWSAELHSAQLAHVEALMMPEEWADGTGRAPTWIAPVPGASQHNGQLFLLSDHRPTESYVEGALFSRVSSVSLDHGAGWYTAFIDLRWHNRLLRRLIDERGLRGMVRLEFPVPTPGLDFDYPPMVTRFPGWGGDAHDLTLITMPLHVYDSEGVDRRNPVERLEAALGGHGWRIWPEHDPLNGLPWTCDDTGTWSREVWGDE
jgi:hypothetical protein